MKKTKWIPCLCIIFVFLGSCSIYKNEMSFYENSSETPEKFGATYMTMNNPYFEALNNSIREVVESNGDILLTRDPAQDQTKQNEQIMDLIEEGVAAIFLNPVNSEDVEPALKACKKAGIPVFNVDAKVDDEEYVEAVILSDNYSAGVQCALDVIERLPGGADIVVLESPDANSAAERVNGFLDTLRENGNGKYIITAAKDSGGELEVAMHVMEELLQADLDFDVVFGENDPTALGALAALQANNISGKYIYGIDGSPDAKAMIKEGYMSGTSAQYPIVMGATAAYTAYDYLDGKEIEKYITVDVELITWVNLSDFAITEWQ